MKDPIALVIALHPGTQYSAWIPVPAVGDRDNFIPEIVEKKKFQIRTKSRIGGGDVIKWTLDFGETPTKNWFSFTAGSIESGKCNGGHKFTAQDKTTMGFFLRAGVFTFLKTSTQLQVWFDDVLEVTWVYEDQDEANKCRMRTKMAGMKFKSPFNQDTVSNDYRYQIGLSLKIPAALKFNKIFIKTI